MQPEGAPPPPQRSLSLSALANGVFTRGAGARPAVRDGDGMVIDTPRGRMRLVERTAPAHKGEHVEAWPMGKRTSVEIVRALKDELRQKDRVRPHVDLISFWSGARSHTQTVRMRVTADARLRIVASAQ